MYGWQFTKKPSVPFSFRKMSFSIGIIPMYMPVPVESQSQSQSHTTEV
jgi:hypothetical protein